MMPTEVIKIENLAVIKPKCYNNNNSCPLYYEL